MQVLNRTYDLSLDCLNFSALITR